MVTVMSPPLGVTGNPVALMMITSNGLVPDTVVSFHRINTSHAAPLPTTYKVSSAKSNTPSVLVLDETAELVATMPPLTLL